MPNTLQTKVVSVQKTKNKSRINKRQRNRRKNKLKLLNGAQNKAAPQIPFNQNKQKNGVAVWQEAYENALRWHGEHQSNFWRHAAEHFQKENEMLRQQLNKEAARNKETAAYETSDEEVEEKKVFAVKNEPKDDEVDSEYLEFLEITFKHREDLRLKRQALDDELEKADESSTSKTDKLYEGTNELAEV